MTVLTKQLRESLRKRIEEGSGRTASSCWLWEGADNHGYPVFEVGGRRVPVRRLVYRLWGLAPPLGEHTVRSVCRVKGCVNPEHLTRGGPLKGGRNGATEGGPAEVKYPWGDWFRRKQLVLTYGEDFHCLPHAMAQQARTAAAGYKLRLRIRIFSDRIEMEVRRA